MKIILNCGDKINIPDGCKAEITDGVITIEREVKEFKDGDILRVSEYENILMREFNDDPNRFDLFTLDEITGDLRQSYTSPVTWEDGTFCISTKGDWLHHNDMLLAVLFGNMKRSSPIFIFEVIGNIHENPELMKGGSNEA